jgi:carboxypeptidase T
VKTTIRLVRVALLLFLAAAAGTGSGRPAGGQDQSTRVLSVLSLPGRAAELRRLGLDLIADWEGRIYILARGGEADVLRTAGLLWAPETGRFPDARVHPADAQTGLNGAYHSYKELEKDIFALRTRHPDLVKVVDLGLSLEKRHIYALKISAAVDQELGKPEVLFLGCHHAREWISVEIPWLLAVHLADHYALDAGVRRLLDAAAVWVVPLVNPDGLEYTGQVYRYWRKNRRDNGDGSFGIDLNRNYGYQWGYDDLGSSPHPDSDLYRGPAAFSEPETRAVRDFFLSRRFGALVSYHSFSQTILYPWGYTTRPAENDATLAALAARMAALIREVNGREYGYGQSSRDLYQTNGDTTDWAYGRTGIPAFTIELPPYDEIHGGFFNAEADIAAVFAENLPAMLYLIDWAVASGGPGSARDRDASAGSDRGGRPRALPNRAPAIK